MNVLSGCIHKTANTGPIPFLRHMYNHSLSTLFNRPNRVSSMGDRDAPLTHTDELYSYTLNRQFWTAFFRPIGVEELTSRFINALVGMSPKIVALRLQ